MVFVATSPNDPPRRTNVKALRKKCPARSTFWLASTVVAASQSRYLPPRDEEIFFPPRNGGLPTTVSNPPSSRLNTSGNSSSQWKGLNGRSCCSNHFDQVAAFAKPCASSAANGAS